MTRRTLMVVPLMVVPLMVVPLMVVPLMVVACGPFAGNADADAGEDATGAETSTAGAPILPSAWMAGDYSSIPVNRSTSRTTGFERIGRWLHFGDDGTFRQSDFTEDFEDAAFVSKWQPIDETHAKVYPHAEDRDSLRWSILELTTSETGCPIIVWTSIDANIDPNGDRIYYPGKVCLIEDEVPPGIDAEATFHAEWCGDIPDGCVHDGCFCQDPPPD